ncbi:MAG: Trm112 family protein [Candidatus Glassbacteria bacterium]
MPLDDRLLEILACPKCKGELEYDIDNEKLICEKCRLKYRVENDIPVMLIDEAESY